MLLFNLGPCDLAICLRHTLGLLVERGTLLFKLFFDVGLASCLNVRQFDHFISVELSERVFDDIVHSWLGCLKEQLRDLDHQLGEI